MRKENINNKFKIADKFVEMVSKGVDMLDKSKKDVCEMDKEINSNQYFSANKRKEIVNELIREREEAIRKLEEKKLPTDEHLSEHKKIHEHFELLIKNVDNDLESLDNKKSKRISEENNKKTKNAMLLAATALATTAGGIAYKTLSDKENESTLEERVLDDVDYEVMLENNDNEYIIDNEQLIE